MVTRWEAVAIAAATVVLVAPIVVNALDREVQRQQPRLAVHVADVRHVGYDDDRTNAQTTFGMRLDIANIGNVTYELRHEDWVARFGSLAPPFAATSAYGWSDVQHEDGRLPAGVTTQYRLWFSAYGDANATMESLEFRGQRVASAEDLRSASSDGNVLLV